MLLLEKSGYASPHSHCVATPVEFLTLLAVTLSVGLTVDYRIPENGGLSRNCAKIGAYRAHIPVMAGAGWRMKYNQQKKLKSEFVT